MHGVIIFYRIVFKSLLEFKIFFSSVIPQIVPFTFAEEEVNKGDSISATCSIIKGDAPINIKWYHNNVTITSGNGITIIKAGKKLSNLIIDSVQEHHIGEYICVASNKGGSTVHSTYLHVNGTSKVIFCMFSV